MGLNNDLNAYVHQVIHTKWVVRPGRDVPDPEHIALSGEAMTLTGTVLYADLADSTQLVNSQPPTLAAQVFKSFLHCALKIINHEGGVITAFDGDRVMAVFLGHGRTLAATHAALKINHAVFYLLNPAFKLGYPHLNTNSFQIRHGVGIDDSELFVAKTGVRGTNDLVWIGRAANYAAKLCAMREANYNTWISKAAYDLLNETARHSFGIEGRTLSDLAPSNVFCSNRAMPIDRIISA